jgi:thiol-disulfide isomerase/thioredoxin
MLIKEGENLRFSQGVSIPIRDGKFEFVLHCEHEEFYQLIFWDEHIQSNWRPIKFISEQGVINFTLHPSDQFDNNILSGGKLNKEYREFEIEASKKHKEFEPDKSVNEKWEQISENGWITASNEHLYYQILREDLTYQEWLRWNLQYAMEHPNIVGYSILVSETRDGKGSINDFAPYSDVFQTIFAPKFPDHPYTAKMTDLLMGSSLKAGVPFIDFTAVDFTGKPVMLSERIIGKPAVLHLWASWCGPCRKANPRLEEIYQQYKDKGFEILGISQDRDLETLQKSIETDQITWTNLLDVKGNKAVKDLHNCSSLPANILIDRNGIVVARNVSLSDIENEIVKLLRQER